MVAPFSLVHAQNRQNRHPFVLNFFIVAIPVLFLASLLTITVLGHFENAALFNDYLVLVKLIEESPIRAVEALAANAQMNVDSARIVSRWKNNWTVYSVFIGIALAVRRIIFFFRRRSLTIPRFAGLPGLVCSLLQYPPLVHAGSAGAARPRIFPQTIVARESLCFAHHDDCHHRTDRCAVSRSHM